jgi:hypothetical protein
MFEEMLTKERSEDEQSEEKTTAEQMEERIQEGEADSANANPQAVTWVLRELRPVSFKFKEGGESKFDRYGFVAQELEKVLPNVVRTSAENYKYVVYQDLIALLTMSAQAQDDRLQEILKRVAQVETRQRKTEEELEAMRKQNDLDIQRVINEGKLTNDELQVRVKELEQQVVMHEKHLVKIDDEYNVVIVEYENALARFNGDDIDEQVVDE